MTTLSTYVNWSEKILNEHLKTEPSWLATCSKVNKTLGRVKMVSLSFAQNVIRVHLCFTLVGRH